MLQVQALAQKLLDALGVAKKKIEDRDIYSYLSQLFWFPETETQLKIVYIGVPVVSQQKRIGLGTMRLQV